MSTITKIYTTVSDRRLHIAADETYLGTVDSYNNCFTQFFAWLFRYSVCINFDGKMRSVNKKSYRQLLQKFEEGEVKVAEIGRYHLFRKVAEKVPLEGLTTRMRHVITPKDRQALFCKLAKALSHGNTEKAIEMIGKGAALERTFYYRETMEAHPKVLNPTLRGDSAGLSQKKAHTIKILQGTPLLIASSKVNRRAMEMLTRFGADPLVIGKSYTFKRVITSVETKHSLATRPKLVQNKKGKPRIRNEFYIKQETLVHCNDSRTSHKSYQISSEGSLIELEPGYIL